MKETVLEKAQRRLSLNSPDYVYDEDLLGDYFDEAVDIIVDWKKASDNKLILSGKYDKNIIQFIIESINIAGLEGQSSSSANGITKSFIGTPESNLKSSIPQSIQGVQMICKKDSKPFKVKFVIGNQDTSSKSTTIYGEWETIYGLISDPIGNYDRNVYGDEETYDKVVTLNYGFITRK